MDIDHACLHFFYRSGGYEAQISGTNDEIRLNSLNQAE